jgi:hypothetical protein
MVPDGVAAISPQYLAILMRAGLNDKVEKAVAMRQPYAIYEPDAALQSILDAAQIVGELTADDKKEIKKAQLEEAGMDGILESSKANTAHLRRAEGHDATLKRLEEQTAQLKCLEDKVQRYEAACMRVQWSGALKE